MLDVTQIQDALGRKAYYAAFPNGNATLYEDQGHLLIDWFYVRPDHRGDGLGQQYLAELKTYMGRALEPVCVLDTAAGFWQKMHQKGICIYLKH